MEESVTPFEVIRRAFGSAVPFAAHAGVEVVEVGAGLGIARLRETPEVQNHIASVHAGAMFTLGETASAVAMLGAFAEQLSSIRPVTIEVAISYLKIARGTLTAAARTVVPAEQLQTELAKQGRATFDLTVDITNDRGAVVAQMRASWTVSPTNRAADGCPLSTLARFRAAPPTIPLSHIPPFMFQ